MAEKNKQRVHRFVSDDFTVRMAAVDATAVVQEMQNLHQSMPLATVAVGRAMVGGLLMASQMKEGQMIGLLFKGNGALGRVYAEAQFEGKVRGYSSNPQYQPPNYDNGLSLKEAMGHGNLTVVRHLPFQKAPFQGTVEMVSGEIGEDIAHYLHQSHQIRSLINLGVYLDAYGKVKAAGGVLIEVMPGVEEKTVDTIIANSEIFKANLSELLSQGAKAEDLIKPYMMTIPFTELEHTHDIEYFCPCTKDRVLRALEILGEAELDDMIAKNEVAEVTCQMCGRPYQVPVEELKEVRNTLHRSSLH
ncbi:MAG: Hsp33 family molecular chaperone HslO [Bdellovibrionia bacterium]